MLQESFNFGFAQLLENDDFIISPSNFAAYSLIDRWPVWESNILLIYGPKSCGKTHLTKIWQTKSGASYIKADDIYSNNYDASCNYILDGVDKVYDEATLFHFFNRMKENKNGFLLMTAENAPQNSSIRLPDLRSRLSAVPSAAINEPDDELLNTIFVKQFSDRQLKVDMEVVKYLTSRVNRSFSSACELVDFLDKQALKKKKNITIPFIKTVFGF